MRKVTLINDPDFLCKQNANSSEQWRPVSGIICHVNALRVESKMSLEEYGNLGSKLKRSGRCGSGLISKETNKSSTSSTSYSRRL